MKSSIKFTLLFLILIGCKKSDPALKNNSTESSNEIDVNSTKNANKFSDGDIAKYAISVIMNQPVDIMNVMRENNLIYVSYDRKKDGETFYYKINIVGNKIIWGNTEGRWRNSKYDENIYFYQYNDTLEFEQKFPDRSKNS